MVIICTHGCINNNSDKSRYKLGLSELVKRISPPTILVYGSAPDDIFPFTKHLVLKSFNIQLEVINMSKGFQVYLMLQQAAKQFTAVY